MRPASAASAAPVSSADPLLQPQTEYNTIADITRTAAVWLTIPGGLKACAVLRRGASEGEIYVDTTWLRNASDTNKSAAYSQADDATGADGIEWNFQPLEFIDAIAGHVSIPSPHAT